ncbi:LOW QUALITY PROTEIN: hypothetical protein QTO34_007976 [Cnephaeus nilssonii]|uniref:Uncharacterized protein n=1 Tax=Cnephaeus nilssonii TaxID=3371016 RepID=A0AA40I9H1_CNENI|nr:LOW QUALITY PROTEIN: hypothetical protein QTO34_007976 [Eptesicus nilssonii]
MAPGGSRQLASHSDSVHKQPFQSAPHPDRDPLWPTGPAAFYGLLYNWKNQNPSFSQNPQGLISLLESVFFTHQPTWDDCQQLLQTLFTAEERERVRGEGRKLVLGPDGQPTTDPGRIEAIFPSGRLQWDHNTDWGREALDRYRQTLLRGIQAAARKPTNLSKVTETVQGPNESPTAFLERLCEAYRVYTPIDPDAPDNQQAINVVIVSQSAPDIRKKLQTLEGFEGKSLSELVEVTQKVFNNREDQTDNLNIRWQRDSNEGPEEKNSRREDRTKRPGWGKNQCAYRKKEGHWKRECPERPGNEAAPEPPVTLNVGSKPVDFLIDTGATFSVLQHPAGPVSKDRTLIQGATGQIKSYPGIQARIANLGEKDCYPFLPRYALALPDLTKPFQLYVAESQGVAKGVLTKLWGPGRGQLPTCLRGWPSFLKAIAATAILVKEASKLTFGQDLQVVAPHAVETLLHSPPERWLSNARYYPVLLLDPPRVSFLKTTALNPATLLPDERAETPLHDCEETLTSLRADLTDQPISNPKETLFTALWRTESGMPGQLYGERTRESISTQTVDIPLPQRLQKDQQGPRGAGSQAYSESGAQPQVHPEEEDIARRCQICAQVNPGPPITAPTGPWFPGSSPGEHWGVDLTELPSGLGGYRYLLGFVDTFSGWPEAYPTRAEAAQVVVKKLLSEILPLFGLPLFMGSDNGPASIAKVTQSLVKSLRSHGNCIVFIDLRDLDR